MEIKVLPPINSKETVHLTNPILLNGISTCYKCKKK